MNQYPTDPYDTELDLIQNSEYGETFNIELFLRTLGVDF